MKNKLTKQEKTSLDNKIVFFSSAIFLYAMLLAFVQQMSQVADTAAGALAIIEIVRWGSLIAAMGCAAWSAYKEKKSVFLYCAIFMFIFVSTTSLRYCTKSGSDRPFLINYVVLAAAFVLVQAYYFLKVKGLLDKKSVKIGFITVCLLVALAYAVISVLNIHPVFYMTIK